MIGVFQHLLLQFPTRVSPVGTRDSLTLTFLLLHLPECRTVMRYSIETSNRLMVHLAELINSYVEAEKASGDVKEVVSPSPRPQMTSKA